jgi:hypothetical protein
MTARVNLTETDFEVQHAGSFLVLRARNGAADEWLYQHLPQDEIRGGAAASQSSRATCPTSSKASRPPA